MHSYNNYDLDHSTDISLEHCKNKHKMNLLNVAKKKIDRYLFVEFFSSILWLMNFLSTVILHTTRSNESNSLWHSLTMVLDFEEFHDQIQSLSHYLMWHQCRGFDIHFQMDFGLQVSVYMRRKFETKQYNRIQFWHFHFQFSKKIRIIMIGCCRQSNRFDIVLDLSIID